MRKRPRDRRRDLNAQTKCGATPPHRAAPARPEFKSKRGKKRKRKKKAAAEDHAEALALADPNAWDLDDASVVELDEELRWATQNGDIETADNRNSTAKRGNDTRTRGLRVVAPPVPSSMRSIEASVRASPSATVRCGRTRSMVTR